MKRAVMVCTLSLASALAGMRGTASITHASLPDCQQGGGQIVNTGTLTLRNCVVAGNKLATNGAGIYNSGTLRLINVIVKNNDTTDGKDGAGIYNSGRLYLKNTTVKGNRTKFGGDGGGLFNAETGIVTLAGATFRGNRAIHGDGGGIYNAGGTITIKGLSDHSAVSDIESNIAKQGDRGGPGGRGGGIYIGAGTVKVTDTNILSNQAVDGAGLYVGKGTLETQDVTIAYNAALYTQSKGGGVYVESGGRYCCASLDGSNQYSANTTIARNYAYSSGGAIFSNGGDVELEASTITDNGEWGIATGENTIASTRRSGGQRQAAIELKGILLARNGDDNCSLGITLVDDGYNLDTGTTCGFVAAPTGTDIVNVGNANVDVEMLHIPGKLLYAEPLYGKSPAIDAWPASKCLKASDSGPKLETDELDTRRPHGKACDIGAFELRFRTT